jgi:DNA repair photolyase
MSKIENPLLPRGRGATFNPVNRFEKIDVTWDDPEDIAGAFKKTQYFVDTSKTVLTKNDSPDVGFDVGLNPYRGCEHGCIYCYARPYHEYLGLSSGLDFESKIFAKKNAAELLRKELSSPKWQPQVIAMSGITDCYQPVEKHLKITRSCLEVLAEFKNPVGIITKSHLVVRDKDILQELAKDNAVQVFISITSLDPNLSKILEPRASLPRLRLSTINELSKAGIPVGVMVAPIIPALNDTEIPALLKAAKENGATRAGFTVMRLPYAVKDLFRDWLKKHFPDRAQKILNRIISMRGGHLNNPHFRSRMRGHGIYAEEIAQLFSLYVKKLGLNRTSSTLSTQAFHRPDPPALPYKKGRMIEKSENQMSLF